MKGCSKCESKSRYCGGSLECLDIKKGDSYDAIIQKINDLLCNELEGTTYTFEDNEDCTNGGIRILENTEGAPTLLYETCFQCCENELNQYLIDAKGDSTVFSEDIPLWVNILGVTYINEPEYSITEGGKYKIILEESIGGEENSRYLIGVGLNSNSPVYAPYSESNSQVTTDISIPVGYSKRTHVFTSVLQLGDEVSIWVKVITGGINLDTNLRLTFERM